MQGTAQVAAQTAASSEDVRYILIIDSNRRLLAHTFHGGIPRGLLEDLSEITQPRLSIINSNEGLIHDTVVPIENGAVGFVRVGMTEQHTRRAMNQHIRDALLTVLAIILGGTDPNGGFGKVAGVVLSLIVLQVISTGLNLMNVSPHFSLAMWGAVLIVVLALKFFRSRYLQKRAGRMSAAKARAAQP